jgi:hypothetical protein
MRICDDVVPMTGRRRPHSPIAGMLLLLGALAAAVTAFASSAVVRPVLACALVLDHRNLAGPYVVRSRLEGPRASAEDPLGNAAGLSTRFARWGKASGCRVDFVRPVTAIGLQEGPLEIVSSATVYRGEAGAQAAFAYGARSLVPAAYVSLPADFPLADRSREWVRQGTSSFGTMLVYLLLWRDRNVNASILIVGRVGVVSAASLAPVARLQQRRIHALLA